MEFEKGLPAVFIQSEDTNDPKSMRFLPGQAVLAAGRREFTRGQAEGSPLAERLFALEAVTGVALGSDDITVTIAEGADWASQRTAVLSAIMAHFMSGAPAVEETAEPDPGFAPEDSGIVQEIRELIDTRVRPAAQQAGGEVQFHGFRDGIVYVELSGQAASLQNGIANVLQHYLPEVTGVKDYRDAIPKPGLETAEGKAIRQALDERINPAVAAHGGHISLVDVQGDRVYIRLEGGCQGCGMANVTLKQGVEVEIRRVAPSISAVLDVTDHAGGTNPYYQPGKGGAGAV
ncbi:MAG: NifU family protein [Pseudomonadota bacterium]